MTRRPDPLEGLGPRLTASAATWQEILGFDAPRDRDVIAKALDTLLAAFAARAK